MPELPADSGVPAAHPADAERHDGAAAPAADAVPADAVPADADVPAYVDAEWRRVSPKYIAVEVIGSLVTLVVIAAVGVFAYLVLHWEWVLWPGIALMVLLLVAIAFEPRRVRSIQYRLRVDDLVFRRGIMFQRQVAVPYGRMQLIDITRGPIARALGLAELKFVTAAAATAVTVPGLPEDEANRLRDELVALAESRRAGL